MPIVDLDTRFRELGRLRLGEDLGDRPTALDVWRLTSAHEDLLEAAATLYGGRVSAWQDGHQLKTETAELEVLLPFQDIAAGQWWELWAGSKIGRRCDGIQTEVPGGPCLCDPAARECKPTTVLRLVLPNLPDLGVWRLVTRSYHAAIELPGSAELLFGLAGGRTMVPAVLGIELRRDANRRPFLVPVLRSRFTLNQLELFAGAETPETGTLPPANRPALAPHSTPTPSTPEPEAGDPETAIPPEWDRLGRLLARNEPAGVPGRPAGELIEALGEVENAMVAAGLWSIRSDGALPLDVVALDKLPDTTLGEWRGGLYKTERLRTFAQRVLIDAGGRFAAHPLGQRVLAQLQEEATP